MDPVLNVAAQTHPDHGFHLIVNGRKQDAVGPALTFDEVVTLAFSAVASDTVYTVTYSKGPKENREGSMSRGDEVTIKNEMVFNVTPTGKS